MKFRFEIICFVCSTLTLSACAPMLVGGVAVTSANVATDRRSATYMASDSVVETKAKFHLASTAFSSSHITVTSYEGLVLLSGEIGTQNEKEKAEEVVRSIQDVKSVINELAVMPSTSISDRMSDSITASKVRAAILDTKGIYVNSMKIVVDRGIVYMLGIVTEEEGNIAAEVASRVSGVNQVVKLFSFISKEELKRRLDQVK